MMSSKVLGALATTMRVWPTTVEPSPGKANVAPRTKVESPSTTSASTTVVVGMRERRGFMGGHAIRWCCGLALVLWLAAAWAGNESWILVDIAARKLIIYSTESKTLASFDDISIGRGGAAVVHYRGDHTTPFGIYRIVAIRRSPLFDTLYELDYPTPAHADIALSAGRIREQTHAAIVRAARRNAAPPAATALGG